MKTKLPYLCILAGAALWGSIGIFVRVLSGMGFSSMQLIAVRAYITAAVLMVFLFVRDRFARDGKKLLRVRLRDCWCFVGTGILSVVFFNYCYFATISQCSLSVAAVLLYTAPSFVLLLSILLFKERMSARKGMALLLAFAGCALVSGLGQGELRVSPIGILTGLGSGLGYALYSIFAKFALARYSPITVTAYTFVFASLGITPLCAVSQFPALVSAQPASLPWMIGLGLLCSALPYLLYTSGLSRTEPGKASILASVEPVVATLLGILVFGEPLTLPGLLGVAAVFASLVILSLPPKARTSSPSTGENQRA